VEQALEQAVRELEKPNGGPFPPRKGNIPKSPKKATGGH